jgi:adenosylmethionine-8-amino-7-oxononanoate aminotransferase
MCRPSFIKEIVRKAKEAGVLVIFDEIMTGFFRTGTWFAMDSIGVIPDFLCLSKGLSGGILPLALTITTNDVFDAFLSDKPGYAFMHGHTYTASPIACAAALASLSLLKTDPELPHTLNMIHETHRKGLSYLESLSVGVQKTRTIGTISACEIRKGISDQKFLERGILIRPLYQNLYMIPPYCITQKELEDAYAIVGDILHGK